MKSFRRDVWLLLLLLLLNNKLFVEETLTVASNLN